MATTAEERRKKLKWKKSIAKKRAALKKKAAGKEKVSMEEIQELVAELVGDRGAIRSRADDLGSDGYSDPTRMDLDKPAQVSGPDSTAYDNAKNREARKLAKRRSAEYSYRQASRGEGIDPALFEAVKEEFRRRRIANRRPAAQQAPVASETEELQVDSSPGPMSYSPEALGEFAPGPSPDYIGDDPWNDMPDAPREPSPQVGGFEQGLRSMGELGAAAADLKHLPGQAWEGLGTLASAMEGAGYAGVRGSSAPRQEQLGAPAAQPKQQEYDPTKPMLRTQQQREAHEAAELAKLKGGAEGELAASVSPEDYYGKLKQYQERLETANQLERSAAISEEAALQAQYAEEDRVRAKLRNDTRARFIEENRQRVIRADAKRSARNKIDSALNDISSSKINPARMFNNTGKRIAAVIAVALGEFGTALAGGGTNTALAMLNTAIDRDVDAQKQDIANKRFKVKSLETAYSKLVEEHGDEEIAENLLRQQILSFAKMEIGKIGDKYRVPIAKSKLATLLSGMEKQAIADQIKLEDKIFTGQIAEQKTARTRKNTLGKFAEDIVKLQTFASDLQASLGMWRGEGKWAERFPGGVKSLWQGRRFAESWMGGEEGTWGHNLRRHFSSKTLMWDEANANMSKDLSSLKEGGKISDIDLKFYLNRVPHSSDGDDLVEFKYELLQEFNGYIQEFIGQVLQDPETAIANLRKNVGEGSSLRNRFAERAPNENPAAEEASRMIMEGSGGDKKKSPSAAAVTEERPQSSLASPVPGGFKISSGHGMREHPIQGGRKMHHGTDWAAPKNTPVLSMFDGTVTYAGNQGGKTGYVVKIKDDLGRESKFFHLNPGSLTVKKGQKVKAGEKVAGVGKTGGATGYHLHAELWVNGKSVNLAEHLGGA